MAKDSKKYQTKQRKSILDLFELSGHRALSAQDVAASLGDDSISISSIYRNLAEMEKTGLLCRVSEKNRGAALYQYVNPQSCSGIIHLKCQDCQETYHLDCCVSDMVFAMAEKNFHFQVNHSTPFLLGLCERCRAKAADI
ncbi:MAG: transcriptional repressor [Akkermansia sp.]